ncbi:hypothetical protein GGH96_002509 [Coemansia sp. RSA 1972]|nr:hypothetical protein GGH96_002509 [Coemansia sp. RSA 1972]
MLYTPRRLKATSKLELCPFNNLSKTAGYVAKAMLTDYSNNVMLRFGDTGQGAVNTLLKCKQHRTELVTQLEAEGTTPADIRRKTELQIWVLHDG